MRRATAEQADRLRPKEGGNTLRPGQKFRLQSQDQVRCGSKVVATLARQVRAVDDRMGGGRRERVGR